MAGRVFGLANGNAKLSDRSAWAMRFFAQYVPGISIRKLSLAYEINPKTLTRIVTGRRRGTAPGPIQPIPVDTVAPDDAIVGETKCPKCRAKVTFLQPSGVCLLCDVRGHRPGG